MVFLEEENHRREGRDTSSRMKFWKPLGGREDEGYKGNTRNILENSSVKKRISISYLLKKIEISHF